MRTSIRQPCSVDDQVRRRSKRQRDRVRGDLPPCDLLVLNPNPTPLGLQLSSSPLLRVGVASRCRGGDVKPAVALVARLVRNARRWFGAALAVSSPRSSIPAAFRLGLPLKIWAMAPQAEFRLRAPTVKVFEHGPC